MTSRAALHEILDRLPEEALPAVEASLSRFANGDDDFRAFLDGLPEDDEPLSERELAAIKRWEAGASRGTALTYAEIHELVYGRPPE
jgi:hypothetical protein